MSPKTLTYQLLKKSISVVLKKSGKITEIAKHECLLDVLFSTKLQNSAHHHTAFF